MILVDTSVWIDHLRAGDVVLGELLKSGRVLAHPFVIGELALGSLAERGLVLGALRRLRQAVVAKDHEMLEFIALRFLYGCGIGYVDAHLLTSARLTPGASVWTRDKRLRAAAERLGLAAGLAP